MHSNNLSLQNWMRKLLTIYRSLRGIGKPWTHETKNPDNVATSLSRQMRQLGWPWSRRSRVWSTQSSRQSSLSTSGNCIQQAHYESVSTSSTPCSHNSKTPSKPCTRSAPSSPTGRRGVGTPRFGARQGANKRGYGGWVRKEAVRRQDRACVRLCKMMGVARETQRLMAHPMAGGDFMRIIEARQQMFYSEQPDLGVLSVTDMAAEQVQ